MSQIPTEPEPQSNIHGWCPNERKLTTTIGQSNVYAGGHLSDVDVGNEGERRHDGATLSSVA
ncbi:hypothetical protein BLOT_003783 [Blomia tropicalis]|nr:hypothetical protein BLOT_003783 [Blomia tropicalis]